MVRATVLVPLVCVVLAACGGGGGGADPAPVTPAPVDNLPGLTDTTVYSSAANASLPGAVEAAAVSNQTITVGGQVVAYVATAGHLIARDAGNAAQASMFYVAYTLPGAAAATRPVTFFYNGGPGSASVWLQLGSFGPRRIASSAPDMTAARPLPMVDNAEHLLGQSDLVFVNAVGSGYSQAIAPFVNRSFWGVDSDAALFRDFILRYLVVNARGASPKFLFGESYGGPRTAVLARRLQEAGVMLDGLVLQSPAMDYNSNCDTAGIAGNGGCGGFLPSYAAVGAFHRLTEPVPDDLETWVAQARAYADNVYAPALRAWLANPSPTPTLWQPLARLTGLPVAHWQADLGVSATAFRGQLLPGQLLGRYDGRMKAPAGSALAAEGDPSSTWIGSSFAQGIATHLRDELGWRNASTYVLLSGAINVWDFSHGGRPLPDTLPDLAAALAQNPRLHVLAFSGYHDLATPFHQTEADLARVDASRVGIRNHAGGHMSYLDDATRAAQLAELKDFYAAALARRAAADTGAERRALAARPFVMRDRAGTLQQPGSIVPAAEPAFQAPMRDPWVPPQAGR